MAKSCSDCPYQRTCIVGGFDEGGFKNFSNSLRRFTVRGKDRAIFNQGEPLDACYFVCAGLVKLVRALPDGTEVIVDVLAPFSSFGMGQRSEESVHFSSIMTLSEAVEIAHIKPEVLRDFLSHYPLVLDNFTSYLAGRTQKVHKLLASIKLRVRDRLLAVIALTIPFEDDRQVSVPLSNTELAHLAQTTPETVSRIIRRLQGEGKIARDHSGGLKIRKDILRESLAQLA